MLNRVFRAFSYPDFRLMWFGACVSSVGTWMQKLAQSWLVLQITGDAFFLGLDTFLGEIPIFLLSLVGGAVADRQDRRRLLIISQFIQLTCAFTLAALFAVTHVEVWMILILSFITGLAQAFGGPAYQALVPTLVDQKDLQNAIALNSIQFNLARVIGPMLGGLALKFLGASWCFGLNGLSFGAVIISLLLLKPRFTPQPSHTSLMQSMREGIGFIRGQKAMESLIALAFCMTFLGIPVINFLPVIARQVFHGEQNADVFTILLCVSGAGSVVGALVVAALGQLQHKGRWALLLLAALGALIMGFSLSTNFLASCVLLFLAGAALISVFALISSLVQTLTADQMRGRVMSVYNVAFRGGMPIGSLLAGRLIHDIGWAPTVLASNGALLVVLALYFLVMHRSLRQI